MTRPPGSDTKPRHGTSAERMALLVGAGGTALFLLGLLLDARQALASYLVAYVAVLTIALGALTLVMIGHLMKTRWITALRPLAMGIVATLPLLAVLVIPLLLGMRALYPWTAPELIADPRVRELVLAKGAWLDESFFAVRAVVYVVTWVVLAWLLRRWSPRPGAVRDPAVAARLRATSAAGLSALAVTLTLASFDWLMSLSPAWYSTVYGVYVFAGGMVGCLALVALLARAADRAEMTRDEHAEVSISRLGMLLLSFVIFWAYIGYSQYLIVWIADVPLEIGWYVARARGSWGVLALLLVAGHFALPLLLLLWRSLKRSTGAMAALGAWLLLMHWLDIYWLVLPELHPSGIAPHWLDLVALGAVGGAAVYVGLRRARGRPLAAMEPAREGEGVVQGRQAPCT